MNGVDLQSGPGSRLVGRLDARRSLEQFVRRVAVSSSSLVIVGEAGIGKTTCWAHGVDRCRALGHRTLLSRPSEDDQVGPLIGLRDLFADVDDTWCLDGAGLRNRILDPETEPIERSRGVLELLTTLSEESPVVVAIDDVQWFDAASGRALRHALRRLLGARVGLMSTTPKNADGQATSTVPFELVEHPERIELGAVTVVELRQILAPVVPRISRPDLLSIHRRSGGNPMLAIEMARHPRTGPTGWRHDEFAEAINERFTPLPDATREAVSIAAVAGSIQAAELGAAVGVLDVAHVVAPAVDAKLLTIDDTLTVRFTHSMIGAALLGRVSPLDRRRIHARLVDVICDPDQSAHHLANSVAEPNRDVAADLEAAATRLARRGAPELAAEMMAHSVRLAPDRDSAEAHRRELDEIAHWAAAGDAGRALRQVDELLTRLPAGPDRIQAISHRVFLDFADSEKFLTAALEDVSDDDRLRGRILDLLGWILGTYRGRLDEGARMSQEALRLGVASADDELQMLSGANAAMTSLFGGRRRDDLMDEALAIERRRGGPRLGRWPSVFRARQSLWDGDLDGARTVFEKAAGQFARDGTEFQRPYRLHDLARLEIAAGRFTVARRHVDDGIAAALDASNPQARAWLMHPRGLVHAHCGELTEAEAAADFLRDWGVRYDEPPRLAMAADIAGSAAGAAGDWELASDELRQGVDVLARIGYRHPCVVAVLPRAIEAAAALGDIDACRLLVEELDDQARDLRSPLANAFLWIARGDLLTIDGHAGAAVDLLDRGATALESRGYRFEAARARLRHGRACLRAGHRRRSRELLTAARDEFTVMGASPWVTAGDQLLARSGGRTGDELTPTERQIAELVATGLRNREIAGDLFVSTSTVEAHLTRIYRKLEIRGRTDLTQYVLADGSDR